MSVYILSLGGGRQSSALLLAAHFGLVERFDHAIFSDTGSENPLTYAWLERLESIVDSIPIHRVGKGSLGEHIIENLSSRRMDNPPFFTTGADRIDNAPLTQKCTREYKSRPIERMARKLAGYNPRQRIPKGFVRSARGISMDEGHRMKPSAVKWMTAEYPLIYELQWKAHDCEQYVLEKVGEMPPKSACWFCPHTHPKRWLKLSKDQPEVFSQAVDFDAKIRQGIPRCTGEAYLHRYRMPLAEAVELDSKQPGLFDDYEDFGCDEGQCGV